MKLARILILSAGVALAISGAVPLLDLPRCDLASAAAPPATLHFVLYALPLGMAVLLPSLWLLFRVFKARLQDAEESH